MGFGFSKWRAMGRAAAAVALAASVALAGAVGATGAADAPAVPAELDAQSLRVELQDAEAQFQAAQIQQVEAAKKIAELNARIVAEGAAVEAARGQIQRYARWAYIAARDAEVAGILARLASGDADSLAEAQILLSSASNVQARELRDAIAVLQQSQDLRTQLQQTQADATQAMAAAQAKGQEVVAALTALAALLGPEPAQPSTTPQKCPRTAPPGALTGGSADIGVYRLCRMSVKQARSPTAARAIVWAFNHLGVRYTTGGLSVDDEHFDGFDCSNYVARAFYWGGRISAFMTLPWTPAYAAPPGFVRPISQEYQSGDINVMWRGEGGIAASGGQAGHAQVFIAKGWVIQSGGIAGITNVAPYPNNWPGWQETHFAVDATT